MAGRDYTAGEEVLIGRDTLPGRPPTARDRAYTVAADTPRGTLLGVGPDGALHPVTAPTARAPRPPRRPVSH